MHDIDCAVIGAGVVGLATARALARQGRAVTVLERESTFGTGISARSSEVVHAGIYYAPGSAKARLCVDGRRLLVDFCATHGVPIRQVGKLVIAQTSEDESRLRRLHENGRANGVEDLQLLTASQAAAMEPALRCNAALWSPRTAIVDSHALMHAVLRQGQAQGVDVAFTTEVLGGRGDGQGRVVLDLRGPDGGTSVRCRSVVNAAGLGAESIARSIEGVRVESIPQVRMARGTYFSLQGAAPFTRLIYPLPSAGGLGIHATVDLAGRCRFGPDVQWTKARDYVVDVSRRSLFAAAIREYYPDLREHSLTPDYAGIRPKLVGPDEPPGDFCISGPAEHGLSGLVSLLGIESPGLTAALALGEFVGRLCCSGIRGL